MYRSVGLDIFLTTALHGQGLGREALRLVIAHYLERGHHRFTIDPAADNERAIRTYAAVGFKPVGRLRDYELGADGTWHDGLLMDLLGRGVRGRRLLSRSPSALRWLVAALGLALRASAREGTQRAEPRADAVAGGGASTGSPARVGLERRSSAASGTRWP